MTITLRPAYLAVAAAFLGGIVVVIAALALRGNNDSPRTALAPTSTRTLAPAATSIVTPTAAAPSATIAEPTTTSTSAPPTLPPPIVATAPPSRPVSGASTSSQAPVSTPAPPQPGSGYTFIGAVWADDSIPIPYCVDADNPPINSVGAPLMSAAGSPRP
jgi:hypothetical protein